MFSALIQFLALRLSGKRNPLCGRTRRLNDASFHHFRCFCPNRRRLRSRRRSSSEAGAKCVPIADRVSNLPCFLQHEARPPVPFGGTSAVRPVEAESGGVDRSPGICADGQGFCRPADSGSTKLKIGPVSGVVLRVFGSRGSPSGSARRAAEKPDSDAGMVRAVFRIAFGVRPRATSGRLACERYESPSMKRMGIIY